MNHYLTPAATAAIKAENAKHIAANNQRRIERECCRLFESAMRRPRNVPAFRPSGFVEL